MTSLYKARMNWRKRVIARKAQGLCAYCDDKSYNNWIRCKNCANINREKSIKYYYQNKERLYQYDLNRKHYYLSINRCEICTKHRRLAKNPKGGYFSKCRTCLDRLNKK